MTEIPSLTMVEPAARKRRAAGMAARKDSPLDLASIKAELGPSGYAAQTWSDIPAQDGRRIQISWMATLTYIVSSRRTNMLIP